MCGAWVIAEIGGAVVGLATAGSDESAWRLVTLLADRMQEDDEATCDGGPVRGLDDGSWEGERLRVRPHPVLVDRPLRDWAWSCWGATVATGHTGARIEVTLAAAFEERHGYQWFFDRVFAAQPRLGWSIRRG